MPAIEPEFAALAAHFTARRDAIMGAWRQAIKRDPAQTTGDSLPRAQLNDHIPALLLTFEKRLVNGAAPDRGQPSSEANNQAAAHGLHRWQQGYDLREVARELGGLNECMVAELDAYARAHPLPGADAMAAARACWAELCGISIGESTAQYFRLQQREAAGHIGDLEQALVQIHELEKERAELWHQAAHDLRGNLGVLVSATAVLGRPGPDVMRAKFLAVLERNVKSLHHLLDDVMDLSRLQAGKERRLLASIDVGTQLRELCEGLEPQASHRNLSLRFEGPAPFMVEGDVVKIRRMTQNLVLNAIKYTVTGGVTVTWGDSAAGDGKRWVVGVQDTGPGFQAGPGSPLAGGLKDATGLARESEADGKSGNVSLADASPHALPERRSVDGSQHLLEPGEGIGLSIVKRLAELLDASIEMESSARTGTLFRIFLPRQYAS